jgi:hypothetical protein
MYPFTNYILYLAQDILCKVKMPLFFYVSIDDDCPVYSYFAQNFCAFASQVAVEVLPLNDGLLHFYPLRSACGFLVPFVYAVLCPKD